MKDKLQNIKDYIQSLSNSELRKLRTAIDLEIYLSELRIQYGEEVRK